MEKGRLRNLLDWILIEIDNSDDNPKEVLVNIKSTINNILNDDEDK